MHGMVSHIPHTIIPSYAQECFSVQPAILIITVQFLAFFPQLYIKFKVAPQEFKLTIEKPLPQIR